MTQRTDTVLVVGAGPAGLATSHELKRRKIDHAVLEKGDQIADTWTKLYESLVLHTGKHLSALPGMSFPASTPLFPSRADFLDYLRRYRERFQLPVETCCAVSGVERLGDRWRVDTAQGARESRFLVMATGILSNPQIPEIPGRQDFQGELLHSVDYLRPQPFQRKRVLVIGVGNSGGEISAELARSGAEVTVSIRSGATNLPLRLFGIPIQYFSFLLIHLPKQIQRRIIELTGKISERVRGPAVLPRALPSACPGVPLIGFHLADAVREGRIRLRGPLDRLTREGARFLDGSEERFDAVILATGFRAEMSALKDLIRPDACGFARRRRRVVSADQPDLFFVGQNYDATGALFNIARDSRSVAKMIAAALKADGIGRRRKEKPPERSER